jgi:hypothetical protein
MKKSSAAGGLLFLAAALLAAFMMVYSAHIVSAAGNFSCSIMASCGGGNTTVIYMKNDTGGYRNAHAQNVSVATYPYAICCASNSTLSLACDQGVFLKLSSLTDAHVQRGDYSAGGNWANSSLDRCMNITIDNASASTLTNFPAYINLTYDSDMLSNFTDIRFYNTSCNNGGSALDYEIENYTLSDRAHVWVKIPSLPSAGTTISVYYKNNTAFGSGENATGVWDSNYVGVWHMTEVNATDSTVNENDGTQNGGVTYTSSGRVDGADDFDGSNDWVNCSNDASLEMGTNDWTISAWIRMLGKQSTWAGIVEKGGTGTTYEGYWFNYYNESGDIRIYVSNGVERNILESNNNLNLNDSNWHHVAVAFDRSYGAYFYVDGASAGSEANASLDGQDITNAAYPFRIGYNGYINGTIDEVRVSKTLRSADWINQSYQMVANQESFVAFGDEETAYNVNACLATTPGTFNCTYVDDACPANRECFASMGGAYPSDNNDTNAHIGPCDEYKRKICCRVLGGLVVSYVSPTPSDGSRRTANSETINVTVSGDEELSIDTCILEWNGANETMTKHGSGTTVTCDATKVTNDGMTYTFKVYANDSSGALSNETMRSFRENDEPAKVTLTSPANYSHITDRTPTFDWEIPSDADGDTLNYTINISCFPACSDDNRLVTDVMTDSYTPTTELQYFGDDNKYYNWSVRAGDGYEYGAWSDTWKLTIDTNVSIIMLNDTIDFGTERPPGYSDNTTDNSPYPFSIRSISNCMIDANISASDLLWDNIPTNSSYFQYKVDWLSGEGGAFNWSGSQTAWAQVPITNTTFVDYLNYTSGNSSFEVDINITVPGDEPPGTKSSTIIFAGEYHR